MTPTNDGASNDGARDRAENRLEGYLAEVREDAPQADAAIVRRVNRSARWQRAVREPLLVAAHLAEAVAEGIATFLGTRGKADR